MIIPINFPLPSTLATISHDELVLIELQGQFDVECTNDRERDGRLVGRLCIDDAAKRPTLMVGHHLLEGKIVLLPKPLAVLRRAAESDVAMECDSSSEPQLSGVSETSTVSWDAIAVVKRKIVFSKRPMPIVGRPA
ncbi:chromosome transmission fidelity protein 8 [Mycena olivaceomarginata]|nr:chromosome transmission fidelity protein 8 [Mycena olivaceomarginata]